MRLLTIALLLFPVLCSLSPLSAQTIETIAGTGKPENNGNEGLTNLINIGDPFGVEFAADGFIYICEVRNHRVWRLGAKGKLTVVAGSGVKGYAGDGGAATAAQLNEPYEVRLDTSGNMWVVEMQNHIVRKVDLNTGKISTVAGTGQKGFGGDGGPATKAQMSSPHSIARDGQKNIYIADIGNHRIRKVDAKTGIITTIAGNGERQLPKDGETAAGKPMIGPRALYFDRSDSLLIALREGHSVWQLDLHSGLLKHVAGTGKRGFTGDGGPALDATFDGPKGIATGRDGHIYVADTENHAIRKIDRVTRIITTIAGCGPQHKGATGDGGLATEAMMDRPHGICVGPPNAVYIGDTLNHRVRRVNQAPSASLQ